MSSLGAAPSDAPLAIAGGGTGAASASAARTALGLGTAAIHDNGDYDAAGAAAASLAAISGAYKLLLTTKGLVSTGAAAGNKYALVVNASEKLFSALTPGTQPALDVLHLLAADLAVAGLTTKLSLRAGLLIGTTAPAVTITVGLYPLTSASNAYAAGTVVTDSTVAFASPSANAIPAGVSLDFTLPSDGPYAIGVIVSGTPSGQATVSAALRYRNV